MNESLLAVDAITVHYGLATAVDQISIHIDAGESVFVVGPNGAGKTTVLRAISGLEPVVSGAITFAGESLVGENPWGIAQRGIAHVPQGRRCFGPLTVEENLVMGAHGQAKANIRPGLDEVYAIFPVLREKRKQRADQLSGGQQQMVAIGRALMAKARLIMLDEPSLGLAPMLVDNLGEVLRQIRDTLGTAILIVEQNVNLALGVGLRGYMLQTGRLIGEGTPNELRGRLREAYLGSA
jgi:branched-chain amino acid transport system ATP-binding protein